jgi:hypothetical protein
MNVGRFVVRVATVALALTPLTTIVGVGTARAQTAQSGSVTCTKVGGTFKYNPALTNSVVPTEVVTVRLGVKKCSAVGGGETPAKAIVSATYTVPDDSCIATVQPSNVTFLFAWAPSTQIVSTVVPFPVIVAGSMGVHPSATYESPPGGTGSYPGSDAFQSSVVSVIARQTYAQIASQCVAGLSTLHIKSGTVKVG